VVEALPLLNMYMSAYSLARRHRARSWR